jgi:hypothetical protein
MVFGFRRKCTFSNKQLWVIWGYKITDFLSWQNRHIFSLLNLLKGSFLFKYEGFQYPCVDMQDRACLAKGKRENRWIIEKDRKTFPIYKTFHLSRLDGRRSCKTAPPHRLASGIVSSARNSWYLSAHSRLHWWYDPTLVRECIHNSFSAVDRANSAQ